MKVSLEVLSKLHNNPLVEGDVLGKTLKATRERTKDLSSCLGSQEKDVLAFSKMDVLMRWKEGSLKTLQKPLSQASRGTP